MKYIITLHLCNILNVFFYHHFFEVKRRDQWMWCKSSDYKQYPCYFESETLISVELKFLKLTVALMIEQQ